VNPDSFRIILNWLRPGGDVETKDVTKRVLDLSDYFGLQDFPKPPPQPNDELITLDLDGEKEIKILRSTITQHSETDIAKFFNGDTSLLLPIFEVQPSHLFVDRPAKISEMFFLFLKNKCVGKTVPYNKELEDELELYGFAVQSDFFKSANGKNLSWQSFGVDDEDDYYNNEYYNNLYD
jgi:hypothetical protein